MSRRRPSPRPAANGPLRAIAYTRLSQAKPRPGDTEIGMSTQLAGCEHHVAALGGTVVGTEQDIISGDRLDRPGLWRAIDRIKTGEANALVVYALDRLGRDNVQQGVVVHTLRGAGGRLLSATENFEEGPLGDFLRSASAFAAAVELQKTRERVTRSLNARFRETGTYRGSRRPSYGYRKIGRGASATYEVDPIESQVVTRIFTERASGASIRIISLGLNADGIPTSTGVGKWNSSIVARILEREVYWTGNHECWRTVTTRDATGKPWREPRPAEDRYWVTLPTIISPALAARARATAERNAWRTRRNDRPAEEGILRYGFARCAHCGRALSVVGKRIGDTRYECTSHSHPSRPCRAGSSITVTSLDGPILSWLQSIIENPSRADAYRVTRDSTPDEHALAAALAAERRVADIEQEATRLAQNLALVTGPAAQIVAEQLNTLSDSLAAARTERDRLTDACRVTVSEPMISISPQDVLGEAVLDAIAAMIDADPEPEQTFSVYLPVAEGAAEYRVPLSWKAWQSALSALNVVVTVAQQDSGLPRWSAEMRLPTGVHVKEPYMSPLHPC